MSQPSLQSLLDNASRQLAEAGVDHARQDARLLLQHAAGADHAALISQLRDCAPAKIIPRYGELVRRRAGGEPVSRILGEREFHGLDFRITPAVLDPRPETELLVDEPVSDFADAGPVEFLDMGTGSGAIAISILAELPDSRCTATDISVDALEVARANAERHGVGERITFRQSDYFQWMETRFDFIVTNPPYIDDETIPLLSREVRDHDPRLALAGGPDGLHAYRQILRGAACHLKPDGRLYAEIGKGQARSCAKIASAHGWRLLRIVCDGSGIERVCVWKPNAGMN